MAEKYTELAKAKGYKLKTIDLYREKNQQSFFNFNDANKLEKTPEMDYFQKKIVWANELVFVFPYWWGGMPSILNNFFE